MKSWKREHGSNQLQLSCERKMEEDRNVARKIFLEGGWTQKRLFDIGWSDVSQCQAYQMEEGTRWIPVSEWVLGIGSLALITVLNHLSQKIQIISLFGLSGLLLHSVFWDIVLMSPNYRVWTLNSCISSSDRASLAIQRNR